MQQIRMGTVRGIRYQASQPFRSGADIDAFRMREDGIALGKVEGSDGRVSAEY
jgi:hypothetical protein